MRSPNFANLLYWQLKECPQGSLYARRVQVLFEALLQCCGAAMRAVWRAMETEVEILSTVARAVRAASPGEARDSRLQVRQRGRGRGKGGEGEGGREGEGTLK